MRRRWLMPPAWVTAARTKSISCSVMSCWNSQIVLKTSPIASGTVVCLRTCRSTSWFSAGVTSSSQNRSSGSSDLAQPGGLVGVQPVVRVVQQRHLGSDVFAGCGQCDGRVPQVGVGVPDLLDRRGAPPGGLVDRTRPC